MMYKEVSASKFDALMKKAVRVKRCARCGSYGGQIRIDFPLYGADGVYCRCYSCGFETKRRTTHICMTDDKKRIGTPTIEKSLMAAIRQVIQDFERGTGENARLKL